MEITHDVKKQIIAYAQVFMGPVGIYFHQFANRPGHMIVLETRNIEGFKRFLDWMVSEVERTDIEVIRTLPEETKPFEEFENRSIGFFSMAHLHFGVATEVNDGHISTMKYEDTGGDLHAI